MAIKNHKRTLVEVKALIDDLETARALLVSVLAQWKRNARLSVQLLDDIDVFVSRSERAGGQK